MKYLNEIMYYAEAFKKECNENSNVKSYYTDIAIHYETVESKNVDTVEFEFCIDELTDSRITFDGRICGYMRPSLGKNDVMEMWRSEEGHNGCKRKKKILFDSELLDDNGFTGDKEEEFAFVMNRAFHELFDDMEGDIEIRTQELIGLEIENIFGVKAVDMKFNGKSAVLSGPNRAGKSSIMAEELV